MWSVDIFCRVWTFCEGVGTMLSVDIFCLVWSVVSHYCKCGDFLWNVDMFLQGVENTVYVNILCRCGYYGKCGHFL